MPTGKKVTFEVRIARIKKAWLEAPRGTLGLRLINTHLYKNMPGEVRQELLAEEPIILTSDGTESCVLMTIEDYFAMLPKDKIKYGPMQVRIKGQRYRQVI